MGQLLLHYGYALLFFGVIVEGDATLVTAAYLSHRGYLRLWIVFLVAGGATAIANQVYYMTGRRCASRLFKGGTAAHEKAQRANVWVKKRGATLLLFSRFLFGLRTAIPAACGAADMPAGKFLWLNAAGAVLWVLAIGFGGHAAGHLIEAAYEDARRYEWLIAGILLIAVFAAVVWRSRGRELRDIGTLIRHPARLASESVRWLQGQVDR
jgi:membrane protein DedA with SNARE-associated domain